MLFECIEDHEWIALQLKHSVTLVSLKRESNSGSNPTFVRSFGWPAIRVPAAFNRSAKIASANNAACVLSN